MIFVFLIMFGNVCIMLCCMRFGRNFLVIWCVRIRSFL